MTSMKFGLFSALALCCAALGGCATDVLDASQSACASFGFVPGTDGYAQCVQQETSMRDDAVKNGPARGGVQGPQIPASSAVGGQSSGVPVFKRFYVSGSNKVCLYNQAGNEVSFTVKAEADCPKTLE
jgi:hypothetical protein